MHNSKIGEVGTSFVGESFVCEDIQGLQSPNVQGFTGNAGWAEGQVSELLPDKNAANH